MTTDFHLCDKGCGEVAIVLVAHRPPIHLCPKHAREQRAAAARFRKQQAALALAAESHRVVDAHIKAAQTKIDAAERRRVIDRAAGRRVPMRVRG